MKSFIPLLFSFLVLSTGFPFLYSKSDSLKINSVGVNNSVVIDTLNSKILSNDSLYIPFNGKISQSGENNSVEIQTSLNLNILSNDSLSVPLNGKISQNGTNNSVQTDIPFNGTKRVKHTVTVKQSGKNNSVKIKSQ